LSFEESNVISVCAKGAFRFVYIKLPMEVMGEKEGDMCHGHLEELKPFDTYVNFYPSLHLC
jgi:hypothetical protein